MVKRKAISKSKRFDVFNRDGFRCRYCGDSPPRVVLHIDHVHPISKGGTDAIDNLVTSCESCNLGKSNKSISGNTRTRLERLIEEEEQLEAFNDYLRNKRIRRIDTCMRICDYWNSVFNSKNVNSLGPQDACSIMVFLDKITETEILHAVDVVEMRIHSGSIVESGAWKYFCGVCWTIIKGENR